MGVSLDLRKAWKHHRHGDLIVVLTWVNDERSLVLLPALRRDAGWYVMAESAAYRWGIDHSDPTISLPARRHALQQAQIACSMLGIEPSRQSVARIIHLVTSWIPDLYRMPSAPQPEFTPGSFGQLILSEDGKPVAGEDLRVEVEGAQYA